MVNNLKTDTIDWCSKI